LATLEAEIIKRPNRDKTPAASLKPLEEKDIATESRIKAILDKYPQHKRVVFLQTKIGNNQVLSLDEKKEVEKFHKLLIK
jgi:hypothetical protein